VAGRRAGGHGNTAGVWAGTGRVPDRDLVRQHAVPVDVLLQNVEVEVVVRIEPFGLAAGVRAHVEGRIVELPMVGDRSHDRRT
jgi:hypothetical protein